jgi:hypothetical protein
MAERIQGVETEAHRQKSGAYFRVLDPSSPKLKPSNKSITSSPYEFMGYALDPYRHPGRIVASRLLGFPCRRGLNPPSFGDRCDCVGNKARDGSGCVVLRAVTMLLCVDRRDK